MDVSRLHRVWYLAKYFGPLWLLSRISHAVRMKSGLIRLQRPMIRWDQQPLSRFLDSSTSADIEEYAKYRATSSPRFFFESTARTEFAKYFESWENAGTSPLAAADDLRNGFVQFFSHERVDVGFPPQWHRDPFSGHAFATDRHWSQIDDFGAGDIKLVWETNRFGFTFPLVRAYWRTGDEQYAELFWQLVEDWHASNAPEAGANWKCGQEISLRVMAWCFGLYGFLHCPATTPARIAMLAQMVAVSGHRVESNIGYALSQKNNHGLSEAMGLWTIGSLFPEFMDSPRWAALGRRLLENQANELIYDDGAFSQHSMNYHRVMLHDYLWSMRLADVQGQPFSNQLHDRVGRAGEFLYQLQDETTGRVPCYGQNDGALILPLTDCDYLDFRPVDQSAHFLVNGRRRLEPGPWDEEMLWMFGPSSQAHSGNTARRADKSAFGDEPIWKDDPTWEGEAPAEPGIANTHRVDRLEIASRIDGRSGSAAPTPQAMVAPVCRGDFDASDGGYSTLRNSTGFAMIRAGRFRHRPSQADMLHIDLWWRGLNVALDPGTYSYNAAPPWDNRLAHTSYHNTVTVDDKDQMDRASRFLWLPWLNGKPFGRKVPTSGDIGCWNGEHDGYRRLSDPIIHRRGIVRIGPSHWLVVDSLQGRQPHSFRLHWLLVDAPYETNPKHKSLELQSSVGRYRIAAASSIESSFNVARARPDSPAGWCSPYYHSRQPAISVSLEATASRILFATVLGPNAQPPFLAGDAVHVVGPDWNVTATLNLTNRGGKPLVVAADADGSLLNPSFSISHSLERTLEPHQCTSY